LISTTLVNPTTCNTIPPPQDGGKCSSIRTDTSPISRMVRWSPSRIERMKKLNQFGYRIDTRVEIQPKYGRSSIFTNWELMSIKRKELINTLASESMSYSTSDLNFQCKELLNVLVQAILLSKNGQRIERLSNSNSTQSPRLLET
jgi:hypothetical protein